MRPGSGGCSILNRGRSIPHTSVRIKKTIGTYRERLPIRRNRRISHRQHYGITGRIVAPYKGKNVWVVSVLLKIITLYGGLQLLQLVKTMTG
jgi:hypothetical protein